MELIEKVKKLLEKEFIRFVIVGTLATAIDAGVFYLVRLFAPYQVAMITGYLLSLIVNYILTVRWTFKKKPSVNNAIAVVAAHLINLFIVRMSLMKFFVGYVGLEDKIAYLPTLVISVAINFFMVKFAVNRVK